MSESRDPWLSPSCQMLHGSRESDAPSLPAAGQGWEKGGEKGGREGKRGGGRGRGEEGEKERGTEEEVR